MIASITAAELAQHRQQAPERWVLLDVREPWEFEHAHIAGAHNVPMATLPERLDEVRALQGQDATLVVICHHGMRSQRSAHWLAAQGLDRLGNLLGGIDAWSLQVDPAVARY